MVLSSGGVIGSITKGWKLMRLLVPTLALAALSGVALAQQAGDADRGHAYAKMACLGCHSIEISGAPSPNRDAPVWLDIVNTSGMTATALRAFLLTPHQKMPDLIIAASDLQDLVAYILTLKRIPPI